MPSTAIRENETSLIDLAKEDFLWQSKPIFICTQIFRRQQRPDGGHASPRSLTGLSHVCITEHYDPDFVYAPGEEAVFELNTDSYLYELLKLRQKYKDQITVGFGVELGLQPHLKRQLAVYAKSYDFDFIIGSSHLCNGKDPYYPEFF